MGVWSEHLGVPGAIRCFCDASYTPNIGAAGHCGAQTPLRVAIAPLFLHDDERELVIGWHLGECENLKRSTVVDAMSVLLTEPCGQCNKCAALLGARRSLPEDRCPGVTGQRSQGNRSTFGLLLVLSGLTRRRSIVLRWAKSLPGRHGRFERQVYATVSFDLFRGAMRSAQRVRTERR